MGARSWVVLPFAEMNIVFISPVDFKGSLSLLELCIFLSRGLKQMEDNFLLLRDIRGVIFGMNRLGIPLRETRGDGLYGSFHFSFSASLTPAR